MLQAKQVTIIGTGLLGASLALALKARGYPGRIVGVGRREQTLEQARGLGCFDGLTTSTAEALEGARELAGNPGGPGELHLAVLAAPLGHFKEIFVKVAASDDEKLIVTDVGSTKASVCAMANELLPGPTRFVGSHPMAGSEQQGPTAADATLFEGKPCVVTSNVGTEARAVELVESVWSCVGMRLVRMSPDEHDKAVALVSHLPHAVAALLVKVATRDDGGTLNIASTGFADTTRIAAGDPGLWVDIFECNKDAVIGSVDQLMEALGRFREMLQGGDGEKMREMLEDAKRTRDGWGGCK
jgi:prephenate dehydrogenase